MKTQDININLIGKKVRGIFTGMEITGTIIDIVSLWSSKMSGTETYGEDVPADPDYARNFICDFILGRPQPNINPTLFDF